MPTFLPKTSGTNSEARMNPLRKTLLVECLRQLADRSFQERVWVRGEGPEVSSYVEMVCQLFDDTGVGELLDAGGAAKALGAEASQELAKLSGLLDGFPPGLDPASLLRSPAWTDVLRTAARAGELVGGGSD